MHEILNKMNIKELFHVDSTKQYEIKKVENYFMDLCNLKEIDFSSDLYSYYTVVGEYHMPVSTLKHVTKHFEDIVTKKRIDVIENIINYQDSDYSYMVYHNIDRRFTLDGCRVNIHRNFIQVLKEGSLYEISTIEKIESQKKSYENVRQISTFYPVHSNWVERYKKLEYSEIIDYKFISEEDQLYFLEQNKDNRIYDLEVKLTNVENVEKNIKTILEITPPIEILPAQLDPEVLEIFLNSMEGKLSPSDIMQIYTKHTLPKINLETATILAVKKGVLEIGSLLYTIISLMLNYEKVGMPISFLSAFQNQEDMVYNLITKQIEKFNEIAGYELISIIDGNIVEKELYELEQINQNPE